MRARRAVLTAVALAAITDCTAAEVSTGSNDGGAMWVDQSVGVVNKIRTRSDISAFVASQTALADKDSSGEFS